jgi:hypothetical protein
MEIPSDGKLACIQPRPIPCLPDTEIQDARVEHTSGRQRRNGRKLNLYTKLVGCEWRQTSHSSASICGQGSDS